MFWRCPIRSPLITWIALCFDITSPDGFFWMPASKRYGTAYYRRPSDWCCNTQVIFIATFQTGTVHTATRVYLVSSHPLDLGENASPMFNSGTKCNSSMTDSTNLARESNLRPTKWKGDDPIQSAARTEGTC